LQYEIVEFYCVQLVDVNGLFFTGKPNPNSIKIKTVSGKESRIPPFDRR
jgi:hypothetical protein